MEQANHLPNTISQFPNLEVSLSARSTEMLRNGVYALAVTGLLLLGMSQLIATDYRAPPEELPPKVAPIHMPDMTPTVSKTETIKKPQEVPPLVKPVPVEGRVDPAQVPITFGSPIVGKEKIDPLMITSDPLPIYKPAPRYPRRAMARGIEGYVVVEFTITTNGSVKNPSVVGGYDHSGVPTDIFDRAALSAVERFKYRPPLSEGQPVERHGVRNRITFRLAD